MSALTIRIGQATGARKRFVGAGKRAQAGEMVEPVPSINFASYEQLHKVLAPLRLTILKALAGEGALSIRDVARRVGRDVQAVHRDVTSLIEAGVVDRTEAGIIFPYHRLHFEFDVQAVA